MKSIKTKVDIFDNAIIIEKLGERLEMSKIGYFILDAQII